MTVYPTWLAGQIVTAAALTGMQTNMIVKQATESVTSSTTLQDDDELVVPVVANATYSITFYIAAVGATAGDINTEYSVPSGTTGFKWCIGPAVSATDRENTSMVSAVHGFTTDRSYGVVSTTLGVAIVESLQVVTGSTAGNVVFRWAQNASSATATSVLAGSYVTWVRTA